MGHVHSVQLFGINKEWLWIIKNKRKRKGNNINSIGNNNNSVINTGRNYYCILFKKVTNEKIENEKDEIKEILSLSVNTISVER